MHFYIEIPCKLCDKGAKSEKQLIKIFANDNITLNLSKHSRLTLKISVRGHACHKARETMTMNNFGIITPKNSRLQGCLVRNTLETTRG